MPVLFFWVAMLLLSPSINTNQHQLAYASSFSSSSSSYSSSSQIATTAKLSERWDLSIFNHPTSHQLPLHMEPNAHMSRALHYKHLRSRKRLCYKHLQQQQLTSMHASKKFMPKYANEMSKLLQNFSMMADSYAKDVPDMWSINFAMPDLQVWNGLGLGLL